VGHDAELHDGVHAPCTHCEFAGHWVWSKHCPEAGVHTPFKHCAPAPADVQSAALWHPLGAVSPPSTDESPIDESGVPPSIPPSETHEAVPSESLHTYPDGQPAVEQSPSWHVPSEPHTSPLGQSLCCVHPPLTPESGLVPITHVGFPDASEPHE
jgi:hypothetical protein